MIPVYVVIIFKEYNVYITSICTEKKCTLSNASDFITVKAQGTGSLKLHIVIGKGKYRGSNYMGYELANLGLKKKSQAMLSEFKIKND